MTTSNRRTSQNIDTLKTHEQKVIPRKHKKLNKNKIKTQKKNKKNTITVGTVLKGNREIVETSKRDTSYP